MSVSDLHSDHMHLLRQSRFLWIFITQTLGCFNDNLFKNAVIILITYHQLTVASLDAASVIAIGAAAFILPLLLLSPLSGAMAIRYGKPHLMQYCKMFEIATAVLATVALYYEMPILFWGVLLMLGSQSALFVPVKLGVVPEICQTNDFLAANSLFDMGLFVASILGAIIGGLAVLAVAGPLIIAIIMLAISVISLITTLKISPLPAVNRQHPLPWNLTKSYHELWQLCHNNRTGLIAIAGISWFWAMVAILMIEMAGFVKNHLHGNHNVAVFLLSSLSIGIACGALLCTRFKGDRQEFGICTLGALIISAGLMVLINAPSALANSASLSHYLISLHNYFAIASTFSLGFGGGLFVVPLYALIHHTTSSEECPQIVCFNEVINALFVILSTGCAVVILQLGFSISSLFSIASVANLAVMLALLSVDNRFVTQLIGYVIKTER